MIDYVVLGASAIAVLIAFYIAWHFYQTAEKALADNVHCIKLAEDARETLNVVDAYRSHIEHVRALYVGETKRVTLLLGAINSANTCLRSANQALIDHESQALDMQSKLKSLGMEYAIRTSNEEVLTCVRAYARDWQTYREFDNCKDTAGGNEHGEESREAVQAVSEVPQ